LEDFDRAAEQTRNLVAEINKVVIGQEQVVEQVLACMLSAGHVLIEGVPGLGKTLLVRAIAQCVGVDSARIQFTPDLMPSDITGHAMFDMQKQAFEVRRGPVFTNLLLADEINRAPAKTQAALLEVMAERQVTIEGRGHRVGDPFMVLATQNPIEQDGTYPLPEAELDRFMMKVLIGYPSPSAEVDLVRYRTFHRLGDSLRVDELSPVLSAAEVLALRDVCARVEVDDGVLDYAVRISRATREYVGIYLGAGPRSSIDLVRVARAHALLSGRGFATPDDVKATAIPVLRHRIQLTPDLEIEGASPDGVLAELLDTIDAPRQ
jgi:MoxR-like ATPase